MSQTKISLIETCMAPVWEKISGQRHLAAIRDGLAVMIPMTMIGGISCLLAVPPVPSVIAGSDHFFYAFLRTWKAWSIAHSSVLMLPYDLTIGIISVYAAAGVACQMAKSYHMDMINNVLSVLLVLLCVSNGGAAVPGSLSAAHLGADYMFGAVVVALLVVEMNHFFIKRNIMIKLPDSVPPNVMGPLRMMIPLCFNVALFLSLNSVCLKVTGNCLTGLVFSVFQPLMKAADSLWSILLINFMITTFWFFGIHGTNLAGVVTVPVTTAALAANMEAYAAGEEMRYIFAGNASNIFGNWLTYNAILIVILTACRSCRLKSVAKIAVIPSVFNINEPSIFGIPTVLNLYTYIPILICNIVNFSAYYTLAGAGILGKFCINLPFTVPGPIAAALSAMDLKNTALWAALLGVDYMIALPFIRTYDRQLAVAEHDEE